MTIREINRTISTANYVTYTISELGGGNIRYSVLIIVEREEITK